MGFLFVIAGDVEECLVQSLPQSQFTPLPEALCWVVLELTSAGQPASLEAVRAALQRSFPTVMETPSEHTIYDALAKLMQERKVSVLLKWKNLFPWRILCSFV